MLQCSFLFIVKEIIIFMTSCKLVIGNYKGLCNANIWMSTALWGISGNAGPLRGGERAWDTLFAHACVSLPRYSARDTYCDKSSYHK